MNPDNSLQQNSTAQPRPAVGLIKPTALTHRIYGTPLASPCQAGQEEIFLGMGCFWGAEKLFWQQPQVISTAVGYAGGHLPAPTYRQVCTGNTGHAEVVRVVYPAQPGVLEQLLQTMLENHDPTQGNRQGNDVGTQYRSAIYCTTTAQLELAHTLSQSYAQALTAAGFGPTTTEIQMLRATPAGQFYLAEPYHQQYLAANPDGYCPAHGTGVCLA